MLAGGLYGRTSGAAEQPLAGYRRRTPSARCCTSWSRSTRRRCSPRCGWPIPKGEDCPVRRARAHRGPAVRRAGPWRRARALHDVPYRQRAKLRALVPARADEPSGAPAPCGAQRGGRSRGPSRCAGCSPPTCWRARAAAGAAWSPSSLTPPSRVPCSRRSVFVRTGDFRPPARDPPQIPSAWSPAGRHAIGGTGAGTVDDGRRRAARESGGAGAESCVARGACVKQRPVGPC
jgi:hypothetical protein